MSKELNVKNSTGITFTRFFNSIDNIGVIKEDNRNVDSFTNMVSYIKLAKTADIPIGTVVKYYDNFSNQRVIAVGTRFGPVVLYDKYSDQMEHATIGAHFRKDVPTLRNILNGVNVSENEIFKILGKNYDLSLNIGFKLEEMAQDFLD